MQFQKKLHFDRFNNTRMTCNRKSLPNRSSPNQSLICHFNFNQNKNETGNTSRITLKNNFNISKMS